MKIWLFPPGRAVSFRGVEFVVFRVVRLPRQPYPLPDPPK